MTSAYHFQVVPGSGPKEHTHPNAEVVVTAGMPHRFVNTGWGALRQTAIHEAPVHSATYRAED